MLHDEPGVLVPVRPGEHASVLCSIMQIHRIGDSGAELASWCGLKEREAKADTLDIVLF